MMARFLLNPKVTAFVTDGATNRAPLAFHRRLPDYAATPLVALPKLARQLGIGQLWVKDESSRLGLPAFKALGAFWATYRALQKRLTHDVEPWTTLEELRERLVNVLPLTLVAATDGNHGRAVARVAVLFGCKARVYIPNDMAEARRQAITSEGAELVVVDGTYDDAVMRAAQEAVDERVLVVSDTAWPGYTELPTWVIDGYSTIFWEVDDELVRRQEAGPDLVLVQMGVGSLAAAVVRHYRRTGRQRQATLVGVEPLRAACVLASMEAGALVSIPGPYDSVMAGLNAGTPSLVAWPLIATGINLFTAIADERAPEAMRLLAAEGIVAGETGAASLAGLIELLTGTSTAHWRTLLGITNATQALVIVTEGATDPIAYKRIVEGVH